MLIDSHAHLEMKEFDFDREEVIKRARQAGVDFIVTVGTNLALSRKAVELMSSLTTQVWAGMVTALICHGRLLPKYCK
jgi:Tat protein secretion system quality control protein TatD with DNase activity